MAICRNCGGKAKVLRPIRENGHHGYFYKGLMVYEGVINIDDAIIHCTECSTTLKIKKLHIECEKSKTTIMKIPGYGLYLR